MKTRQQAAEETVKQLGWENDGTAEANDIKKAFLAGCEYEREELHKRLICEADDWQDTDPKFAGGIRFAARIVQIMGTIDDRNPSPPKPPRTMKPDFSEIAQKLYGWGEHKEMDAFTAGANHGYSLAMEHHMCLIERAFVAGRSKTTWEQFKLDNGLPFKD